MFDQIDNKSKYNDILSRYPKQRITLNEKYQKIYNIFSSQGNHF